MRSKSRRKNKIKVPSKKAIFIALIILGFSFYFFMSTKKMVLFDSKNSEEKLISPKSLTPLPPTLTPTPIFTPTPTLIPTATPVPLVGYCINVPVLMYHHIQPQAQATSKKQTALNVDSGVFDQQMSYLSSHGYNFLSADQLINALRTKSGVTPKSILVTLDDGYLDAYQYAYPIFQKYHIKANLMIPTGLLGGADYMSWSQIEEMQRSGLIYWTDHTWSHYSLPSGTTDKIKYEVNTARDQLQQHTGQTVNIFTYPYGSFNNLSMQILTSEGFIGAFSTTPGNWQCDSFIMTLHRKRIGNSSMAYYGL